MSRRPSYDEAEHAIRRPKPGAPEFGLFAEPEIRTPAPSAPGSETSALAADDVHTSEESRRVLIWFAAQSQPRTRHECATDLYAHLGVGAIGPACARINELVTVGWLEEVGRVGKRATVSVTKTGRAKAALLLHRAA